MVVWKIVVPLWCNKTNNMKKNTPQTQTINLGGINLRVCVFPSPKDFAKSSVTFESVSKNWKVVFAANTKIFFHISEYIKRQDIEILALLGNNLYQANVLTVLDAEFSKGMDILFEEFRVRTEAAVTAPTEETEKEILTQERLKEEARKAMLS